MALTVLIFLVSGKKIHIWKPNCLLEWKMLYKKFIYKTASIINKWFLYPCFVNTLMSAFSLVCFLSAKNFGYKRSPPPFLSLNSTKLKKRSFTGINFASGGSGLFDLTGQSMVSFVRKSVSVLKIILFLFLGVRHIFPLQF